MADFVRTEMHLWPEKKRETKDFHKCVMWNRRY
nr:MAG TPA: hypothetical protein [Caudoviricetes sp.]